MFGSQRKTHKNSARRRTGAKAHASIRRLGVESMERRLMLSATIGGTAAVQVPTIDPSTITQTLFSARMSPTDGGFIVVKAYDNNGTGPSGVAGQNFDQDVPSLDYRPTLLNTGQAVGNPDLLHLYDGQYTNADHGIFTSWTGSNGIQPISMILVYAPGSELPAIGGSVTTQIQPVHSPLEGGSISISNLLTSVKQEQSVTAVEHGIAPESNIANELRHANHPSAAPLVRSPANGLDPQRSKPWGASGRRTTVTALMPFTGCRLLTNRRRLNRERADHTANPRRP